MAKKQARRSKEYWDRKKRSRAKEKTVSGSEPLTRKEQAPSGGLMLPSEKSERMLLVEGKDGSLVSVPEDRLGDWIEIQGQGAVSQEQSEAESRVLDRVLEMLYGGAERDS